MRLQARLETACANDWEQPADSTLPMKASFIPVFQYLEDTENIKTRMRMQPACATVPGRVRQFNAIDPVTYPPSHGDREGYLTMRQWTGPVNDAHRTGSLG